MVTIADVARHAGVSQSTVSYALSKKRSISPETAQRVEASIAALGYQPHASARALAGNRSFILGLVVPLRVDTQLRIMMEFVMEAATSARRHNYDLLLLTADEGPQALRRATAGALVDGLVVMDVEFDDPRVPVLRNLDRPSVLIGVPADPTGLTCIDLDFTVAGSLCVHHLADLGHRRLGFVGQPKRIYSRHFGYGQRARDGVMMAAKGRHVKVDVSPCGTSPADAAAAMTKLWSRRERPTGLVVHNEAILPSILGWARNQRLAVPGDLSVVAICPSDVAESVWPGLTYVELPAEELSSRAVELLMSLLEGDMVAGTTLLVPRLITAGTTGPAC